MLVGSSSQQSQLALGQSKGGTHQGLWGTDHTTGITTPALSPGFGKGRKKRQSSIPARRELQGETAATA